MSGIGSLNWTVVDYLVMCVFNQVGMLCLVNWCCNVHNSMQFIRPTQNNSCLYVLSGIFSNCVQLNSSAFSCNSGTSNLFVLLTFSFLTLVLDSVKWTTKHSISSY